jgi:hypothetical protein
MTAEPLDLTDPREVDKARNLAERGRLAAEALAAADQAARERRTAELLQAQEEYDADLSRRAPALDAELSRQRQEAARDLDAAASSSDIERAMQAWREEATARLAQRGLRDHWRAAHERSGLGAAPAERSMREHEQDEHLAFLPSLGRALSRAAQVDAEVSVAGLVGERPTALPSELLPGPEELLEHAAGCPDPSRTERATAPAGSRSTGVVLRCMSCSASRVLIAPPPEPEEVEAAQRGKALPLVRLPAPGDRPGSGG